MTENQTNVVAKVKLWQVERPEDLQGGTRGAPRHQQPLAEAELGHALPAFGVLEAEGGEGEVPAAPHAVFQEIKLFLVVAHLAIVIGRTAYEALATVRERLPD